MDLRYPVTGLVALMLAAIFFAASWGIGRLLLPRTLRDVAERPLIELAIGTGVLGYFAFALGVIGFLRPPALALGLALGTAVLGWSLFRNPFERRPLRMAPDSAAETGSAALAWGAAGAIGLALLFATLGAMLPEIEYDALWYHLTFPRRYLESGFLLDFPCEHMSPTPQHVELLYGYGLLLGDARAAKFIHYGFGLLAATWAAVLAARLVGWRWALVAAALFLTAPTVTWEMTTAYNELPLAFVGTGAVAVLLQWRYSGDRRLLALAGVLLGFGMAGKHLAMFFLAPLALGVLLVPLATSTRTPGRRIADAALLCAVAFAVATPWYVRAWMMTGNPLFPMFYDQLAALGVEIRRWDAQAQQGWSDAMARYGHGRSLRDLILLPFRATWYSTLYHGSLGPAWLLGLPMLVLVWRRLALDTRLIAGLVLIFIVLWASPWSSFQVRYLVPIAPLAGVLIAAIGRAFTDQLNELRWKRACRAVELGVVTVLVLNLPLFSRIHDARMGWIATTFHDIRPRAWLTVLGLHDSEQFLRSRLESYGVIPQLNAVVPRDGRVVWFGEAAHFYAAPELVMDYSGCVAPGTWGARPGQEEQAYGALRAAGVTHIAWDLTRKDINDERFAIRSPEFVRRFAEWLYEDDAIVLYALRREPVENPQVPLPSCRHYPSESR